MSSLFIARPLPAPPSDLPLLPILTGLLRTSLLDGGLPPPSLFEVVVVRGDALFFDIAFFSLGAVLYLNLPFAKYSFCFFSLPNTNSFKSSETLFAALPNAGFAFARFAAVFLILGRSCPNDDW